MSSAHLVCLLLVSVLWSRLWVWCHLKVPSVQLHDVPVLHMGQDLSDGLVCVTLTQNTVTLITDSIFKMGNNKM